VTIAKAYGLVQKSAFNGEIDYDSGTIKCMLCTVSYVPNQDTHQYKDDVTNEVSGTGYTAGGVTLTSKTVNYNTSTNALVLDAADPTWASLTVSGIRIAVFYLDTGTPSTSPLLSYMDFEAGQSPSSESFTIVLPSTGILQSTAA
jgi:hypothetical protein